MNTESPVLFDIGELVEVATYVQNDGWRWLGRRMIVIEDDGSALIKGEVQTRNGPYLEYLHRAHVRPLISKS